MQSVKTHACMDFGVDKIWALRVTLSPASLQSPDNVFVLVHGLQKRFVQNLADLGG